MKDDEKKKAALVRIQAQISRLNEARARFAAFRVLDEARQKAQAKRAGQPPPSDEANLSSEALFERYAPEIEEILLELERKEPNHAAEILKFVEQDPVLKRILNR